MVRALVVVLRARRRIAARRLKERAFELFVLGPLIFGAVAWVGERYLHILRPALLGWLEVPVGPTSAPALAVALLLTPLLWPGALRELFSHEPLDALPVPEPTRLAVTLLATAGRALAPSAVLLGIVWVLQARSPTPAEVLWVFAGSTLLAWLALALAAGLVHFGAASTGRLLAIVAVAALCAFGPIEGLRLALLPWGLAGSAVHTGLGGVGGEVLGPALAALLTLAAVAGVHLGWRRRDLERSTVNATATARSWVSGLRVPAGLDRRFGARWPGPMRALLRRDLLLVWRRFGPAAHLTAALAVAWMAFAAAAAFDPRLALDDVWRLRLVVGGSTLAVLSTVAVVPFLLHRQLPVFWLEKATGVPLEQVWSAKVWLSLVLALPGYLAGSLLILTGDAGGFDDRILACGQLFLTSSVVSSLIGLACFEISTEPLIGTLWSGLVALALASLFVLYPQGWWLWLIAYAWAAGEVAKRASRRVKLTEVAS